MIQTEWTERLPQAGSSARTRAQEVVEAGREHLTIGGYAADPWRDAEKAGQRLAARLWPPPGRGRLFPLRTEGTGQVDLMEHLRTIIQGERVARAIIADPYFGLPGVDMLLIRLQNPPPVLVIASNGVSADPDGDATAPDEDYATRLAAACHKVRRLLPTNLQIINLTSEKGAGAQFHDRYVVLEMSDGTRQAWMLSNSLNYKTSVGYPVVLTPLEVGVAEDVARYVQDLERVVVPGHPGTQRREIWPEPATRPAAGSEPGTSLHLPGGLRRFDGWETIITMLGPQDTWSSLRRLWLPRIAWQLQDTIWVAAEFLVTDSQTGDVTWRVAEERLAGAVQRVRGALNRRGIGTAEGLLALAGWHYHGGPEASASGFEASWAAAAEEALDRWVKGLTPSLLGRPAIALLDDDLPLVDAYAAARLEVTNADRRVSYTRLSGGNFLASLLWRLAPERLLQLVVRTKSYPLLALLLDQTFHASEATVLPLLRSEHTAMRALGAALVAELQGL